MNNNDSLENHTDLISLINSNKSVIVVFTLVSVVLSLLFTSLKEKKYTSSATFFPSTFNSPDVVNQAPRMGYNIEADRLIQLGQSNALKDSLSKHFDLTRRFEIDTSKSSWINKLHSKVAGMMSFERTKYMSVVLSFSTNDPVLSAQMANYTVELISRFWERLYKENSKKSLVYNEKALALKNKKIVLLLDSISILRKNNKNERTTNIKAHLDQTQLEIDAQLKELDKITSGSEFYNAKFQLEILTEKRIETMAIIKTEESRMKSMKDNANSSNDEYTNSFTIREGAMQNLVFIEEGIESLKTIGRKYDMAKEELKNELKQYQALESQYETIILTNDLKVTSLVLEELESQLAFERQQLNLLKSRYEDNYNYYFKPLPNIFISEEALPNYTKSSPSYVKNAAMAAILGLLVAVLFVLLFSQYANKLN